MRIWLLALMMWPGFLDAETAEIRTGWHPTFTRIVVSIPVESDWKLGRIETGFGLRVAGVDAFDTTGFFRRLPLDRISAVDGARDLNLSLGCDCHATAFLWRPDRLVVDIRDGPASSDNPFEVALTRDQPAKEDLDQRLALDLLPRPQTRVTLDDVSPIQSPEAPDSDLRQIEKQIIDSLTRAADQGLLTLNSQPVPQPIEETLRSSVAEPVDASTQSIVSDLPIQSGVRTRTSVEIERGTAASSDAFTVSTPNVCWPDAHIEVGSWAEGDDFSAEIATYRSRIYGEFDRIDHDAVTGLARTFLYYGFGREAVQTLEIDGEMTSERAAMIAMARIIDDETTSDMPVAHQVSCAGQVVLWAVLAAPVQGDLNVQDIDRVVRDFKALPEHLRGHLAARMAERLAALGKPDLAEDVLSSGPIASENLTSNAIVAANIAADRGDLKSAEGRLLALAKTDDRLTPEALITLIELQIAQDIPVEPEMLLLLETKRFEHRDDPIDVELAIAQMRAQLTGGYHAIALETARALLPRVDAPEMSVLMNLVAEKTTENASDMDFLTFAFAGETELMGPGIGNTVAKRLLALGFPERADELLRPHADGDDMAERRYLRAQAAMAVGQVDRAETILAGITTDRAMAILARVSGSRVIDDESAPIDPGIAAWRSGNWTELATGSDELLRDASELALRQIDSTPSLETPLASGRALIEQAGLTRKTVDDLLDRFEVSENEANEAP